MPCRSAAITISRPYGCDEQGPAGVKKKSSRTKALRKHRRQRDQELAHQVAERIRDATERSNTLGNYLPPGLRRSRGCVMLPGCAVCRGIAQPTGAAGVDATWQTCWVASSWW
jgi:hypothetical protein